MEKCKIGLIIFLLLALVISLFPPFKFGDKCKKYDSLFGEIEKNVVVYHSNLYKKFYNRDSLSYYENLWSESDFTFYKNGIDSFFRLNNKENMNLSLRKTNIPLQLTKKTLLENDLALPTRKGAIKWTGKKWNPNSESNKPVYIKNSIWGNNEISLQKDRIIDSVKKFDEYIISYPIYRNLKRTILFGELLVEYFIAFILSAFCQIVYNYRYSKKNKIARI